MADMTRYRNLAILCAVIVAALCVWIVMSEVNP